ncbi:hypothetical protein E2C01_066682 [Portunus trituberculatus]|uniref:Uncharacterized protein n=1 Tax=Portunus trituberculatus TaxID=210409 RepID=A0A5B7HUH4_PORTR|nr:hypothetical protein [Portunus trituberculatus]
MCGAARELACGGTRRTAGAAT